MHRDRASDDTAEETVQLQAGITLTHYTISQNVRKKVLTCYVDPVTLYGNQS